MDEADLKRAEAIVDHPFTDRDLLAHALVHASLADTRLESNERLEFLGDAILGMIVCEYLFRRFDRLLEGELTKIKSSVVSRHICAEIARELELDDLLRLGKGMNSRTDVPNSLAAAVYESIIGALFLDAGIDKAREFILRTVGPKIDQAVRLGHQHNFKSILQQTAQELSTSPPQYIVLDEQGPDHAKCFEVCVELGPRRFRSSWGASKKSAEQDAALEALLELGVAERTDDGEVRLIDYESD